LEKYRVDFRQQLTMQGTGERREGMNILLDREYTPEDLLALPDPGRYELIDGHLVERAMGAKSSRVGTRLASLLDAHAVAQKLGLVFGSDCGFQIFPNQPARVRFPDVSFVARGRLPKDEPPDGHIRIRPDLTVEVSSPNDLVYELEEKVEEFLKVGVPLVWVIHPPINVVVVFRADGSAARLRETDTLSGESVIPGFSCRVADLFASP
jgi:Uma2 family endonuclease